MYLTSEKRRPLVKASPAKLVFSVVSAACACALAVAVPHLSLASSAFKNGAPLPAKYTCDGANELPPLKISGVPKGAAGLALLVEDPDAPAGLFTHLLAWNLPASTQSISGGLPATATTGRNDFGKPGWGSPCPPAGNAHRYRFHLYALKEPLVLAAGATRAAFDKALGGNLLGEATLFATYARK